ncbi:hypothetical protein Plec18167_001919 [Paecilomyces lecythidis]|uniref:Ribonucleases P/MRP subunit Pop8-like domain-containing protein n=1 Tax=Paecilomyces lecythidis TaxID=3004212 RepID=A0ABR3YBN2_9EURO
MATKRKAPDTAAPPASAKPGRGKKDSNVIHFTARNPPWSYIKLQLIPQPGYSSANAPLDELTTRTYLSSALAQFLGVTGTAISIDIMKVENDGANKYAWIRVPRDDASAVVSAVSSWIGGNTSTGSSAASANNVAWRVCAKGNFLGAIVNGSGADLFAP